MSRWVSFDWMGQGAMRPVAPGPERISPMARAIALSLFPRRASPGRGAVCPDGSWDGAMVTSLWIGSGRSGAPAVDDPAPR